ncbi:MAG: putative outer rane cation efflux protein [Rhodocyclales bacterium]|nr:putative outer rane cation efflux protein [Rhodocyclales bacterium]
MKHYLNTLRISCALSGIARGIAVCLSLMLPLACPPVYAADTLSLNDALNIAIERSPQTAAIQAQTRAAHEQRVAVGELPDPVLKLGVSNVPVTGDEAYSLTRESMTQRSVGLMQEFTRGDKREARVARVEREIDTSAAMLRQTVASTRRDTALAWLEVSYQENIRDLVRSQIDEAGLQAQAAETAFRAARGSQSDVLAARTLVEQLRDQLAQRERDVAMARTQLARWIGDAAQQPLGAAPDIATVAWTPKSGARELGSHPTMTLASSQVALAEADAEIARRNRRADWTVEVTYSQRGPSYSNMVSLNLSVPLQWDRASRQDRELATRLAQVEQARAQAQDTQRAYQAEVDATLQAWDANRQRLVRYEQSLLPLARDRMQAALSAFRGGSGALSQVLEARRMLLDTRIERERVALEAARAWAQLNFLNPEQSVLATTAQ